MIKTLTANENPSCCNAADNKTAALRINRTILSAGGDANILVNGP